MGAETARLFGDAGEDILDVKGFPDWSKPTMKRKQSWSSREDMRSVHRLRGSGWLRIAIGGAPTVSLLATEDSKPWRLIEPESHQFNQNPRRNTQVFQQLPNDIRQLGVAAR